MIFVLGRITGMMYTLMAPVQFVLSPALTVTLTTFHDSFRPLNLIEMAALVPMIALTCLLQEKSKEPAVAVPKNNNRNTLPIPSSLSYSPGGYSERLLLESSPNEHYCRALVERTPEE